MEKLLVVITSEERAEIGDAARPNDRLWATPGWKPVNESNVVWVINGLSIGLPDDTDKWRDGYAGVVAQRPNDAAFDSIGVIYHRSTRFDEDETSPLGALSAAFPNCKHNNYSHGLKGAEWDQQKLLATAIEANPQAADAKVLFDRFWLTCFGDPILEDLILLLKTHASKKADKEGISDLETLKSAVNGEATIGKEALDKVHKKLAGESSYEALRNALVKAVVEQEGKKRG